MNITPIIQNIEGTHVKDDDQFDIDTSVCTNCNEYHNGMSRIMYVRTSKGTLLWWHTDHCVRITLKKNSR